MIYHRFKLSIAAIAVLMASSALNAQQTFMVNNLNDAGAESPA